MENLTEKEFKEKIFNYDEKDQWEFLGDKPYIIEFGADWCAPCKIVTPILEELSEEYKDKINIKTVDVDKEHNLSAALGIRNIPAILFVPINKEPEMTVGALPKKSFIEAIEELFEIKETALNTK